MAVAAQMVSPPLLTYEQYMAEGEVDQRYDILDGVRILMTNPTREHQDVQGNIYEAFRAIQRTLRRGRAYQAPCDILIALAPLRVRQPDVLFISAERLAQNPPRTHPAPLRPAPELVVEILSPSDTPTVLNDKLSDYQAVGVMECWAVRPGPQTVTVLRLTSNGVQEAGVYGMGETVPSLAFPELTLAVEDIFAE